MRVLVSGPTGFIGGALLGRLLSEGRVGLRGAVRRESHNLPAGIERVVVGGLTSDTDWQPALSNVDVVIHLAARVHVQRDIAFDPLTTFRISNTIGTEKLARQAAAAGVRRFVFLSSVKVNGEGGPAAYRETDSPAPQDAYAISKLEAELRLREIAAETNMEVAIIRPPLVYGPGVKANFYMLLRAVALGVPLPLGSINNRRSLVALDNLVDLIITCIHHPSAANQTFLVSDGEDLSTTELIRRLARAMGRPVCLIPVPTKVLLAGATLLGKYETARRLCGSLQVDTTKVREQLGWRPPITMNEGLSRVARSFGMVSPLSL